MAKNLESRIAMLERISGSRDVVFVAHFRHDGTLVPLPSGSCYARNVALLPEYCSTFDEWRQLYAPQDSSAEDRWRSLDAAINRAAQALPSARR